MPVPDKIRIVYDPADGSQFRHVGALEDGRQFLAGVTSAFPGPYPYRHIKSDWRKQKRWLAVLHLFAADGTYESTETKLGGFESEGRALAQQKATAALAELLAPFPCDFGDIHIRLFATEIEGVQYALKHESETDEAGERWEWVMLFPDAIMFHPPWDSGLYST